MDDNIEFMVHHGGFMILSASGATYEGGEVVEAEMMKVGLTYSMMKKICSRELHYETVDKMFFLSPGTTLADGGHVIASNDDVDKVILDSSLGVVTLFVEATKDTSYMGDNEENISDWEHGNGDSDTDAEHSVVPAHVGVIHLISDSGRNTDPEFLEAMVNLGVANRRRQIRVNMYANGVEVDQLNEVTVHPEQAEEINMNSGAEVFPGIDDITVNLPPPVTDEDMADDEWDDSSSEDADYEPSVDQTETESEEDELEGVDGSVHGGNADSEVRSSYRASSQSDHVVDDKADGEEVSSLDRQAYYDPKCDHKYLVFREGLKFTSLSEFKDAIINYSIAVGADIRWSRSNNKNKEAVCTFETCKWRVFASWVGENESFAVKSVGLPHCSLQQDGRIVAGELVAGHGPPLS
ncbi:hypothetical protein LINGRAHAP2_LOCUS24452 [Linum grandiflorum]